MKTGDIQGGQKCEGETIIRSGRCAKCHIESERVEQSDGIPDLYVCPKCGGGEREILVMFKSKDAEGYWPNEYERLRIDYCIKHRRDEIPVFLRTGKKPWWLRLLGHRFGAKRLRKLTLKEAQAHG